MKRAFFTAVVLALFAFSASTTFAALNDNPKGFEFESKTLSSVDANAIKKLVKYPFAALDQRLEGRFDILVYIAPNGNIVATNFEIADESKTTLFKDLIIAATEAVTKYRFSPDYNGSVVRIPFAFKVL